MSHPEATHSHQNHVSSVTTAETHQNKPGGQMSDRAEKVIADQIAINLVERLNHGPSWVTQDELVAEFKAEAQRILAALKAARIAVVELPEPSESDCCGATWYQHGTTVEFLANVPSYVTGSEGDLWTVDDARSLAAEFWAAADVAEAAAAGARISVEEA